MKDVDQSWEKFLNPASLKRNLVASSVFLAAYEMMKHAIVTSLRDFFSDELVSAKAAGPSEMYKDKVLSLHKSEMTSCAMWYKNTGALDDTDLQLLRELADHRNIVAHELPSIILSSREVSISHLHSIFELTSKVDQWWFREVEMSVNPELCGSDLTDAQINEVSSLRMLVMGLMIEVAQGNDARMSELYSLWQLRGTTSSVAAPAEGAL